MFKGPSVENANGAAHKMGNYRADIDGLRAFSVLLVLGYHFFPHLAPGGFIGVDIFFVISGFLITGAISKAQNLGKFSLADFFIRRINRIFPVLLTVIFAGLVSPL